MLCWWITYHWCGAARVFIASLFLTTTLFSTPTSSGESSLWAHRWAWSSPWAPIYTETRQHEIPRLIGNIDHKSWCIIKLRIYQLYACVMFLHFGFHRMFGKRNQPPDAVIKRNDFFPVEVTKPISQSSDISETPIGGIHIVICAFTMALGSSICFTSLIV